MKDWKEIILELTKELCGLQAELQKTRNEIQIYKDLLRKEIEKYEF